MPGETVEIGFLQILKRIHHPVHHSLHPASHLIGHSLRVKLNFNESTFTCYFTIIQAVIEFARRVILFHFSYPETHQFQPLTCPVAESVTPLLPLCYPLVTPVVEFGHQAELPPPVPEALGGALTATFLILMTTGEGEGIVGRGGMKGFPEPNFKANWENG